MDRSGISNSNRVADAWTCWIRAWPTHSGDIHWKWGHFVTQSLDHLKIAVTLFGMCELPEPQIIWLRKGWNTDMPTLFPLIINWEVPGITRPDILPFAHGSEDCGDTLWHMWSTTDYMVGKWGDTRTCWPKTASHCHWLQYKSRLSS